MPLRESPNILQVYEVDPLVCPKCGGDMKVVAAIEDPAEIRRILRYLGCIAEQRAERVTRLIRIGRSPPGVRLCSVS
jgi:hypothetical protein